VFNIVLHAFDLGTSLGKIKSRKSLEKLLNGSGNLYFQLCSNPGYFPDFNCHSLCFNYIFHFIPEFICFLCYCFSPGVYNLLLLPVALLLFIRSTATSEFELYLLDTFT